MGSRESDVGPILEAMEHGELIEFCQALDRRVRGGKATLEDFGKLARAHQELSRRGATLEAGPSGRTAAGT